MGNVNHRVKSWVHGLIAAFQFLSRIPVPIQIHYDEQVFKRSVSFYPLVGGVIGLLLYGLVIVSGFMLPPFPASVLLLVGWIVLTGALHLDGLMDTADGILSHRSREQMLDIMKDSRVGAMGVIVCVLYLLMKVSLIDVIVTEYSSTLLLPLIVIPIWSRWFMTLAITAWPYARPNSGLGSYFKGTPKRYVGFGFVTAILLSVLVLIVSYLNGLADLWQVMLYVIGGMLIIGFAAGAYLGRKLGGLTGDTYGAINEMLELTGLLIIVSFYHLSS
jgi:adenosylcobinamide-GDP ribazoletransferase